MSPLTSALKELSGSIALMALLAVAFGAILRASAHPKLARMLLGLLFGAAAMAAMHDRIPIADGVFVDLRHLPIALAGGFLGWRGAAPALVLALAMRLWIGGSGVVAGVASLAIAAAAGLLWHLRTRGTDSRGLRAMLGLAFLSSLYPVGMLLLPAAHFDDVMAVTLPVMLPLHALGVVVVGLLIERERRLCARERRLLRDADHDLLTGLLNRRGFDRALGRLPDDQTGALLLLDLDHFKRINDVHGHAAGDTVLCGLSERLLVHVGPDDVLARLGGEEFIIFLPGQTSEAARLTGRRLCEAIRSAGFVLPERKGVVRVTISIGGAWGPRLPIELLLSRADAALYAAKRAGRDQIRLEADSPAPAALSPGQDDLPPQLHHAHEAEGLEDSRLRSRRSVA